jgi:hypothetical protein
MLRPNDAPIAHSKVEYRTKELEYQFGEYYHLDAAYLPAPQAGFGRLSHRYAYIACDHKSGHGLFNPSHTLNPDSVAQVILYIYTYNYIKYRIKIRTIATDAHPSFTARELDSLKFDLGIVFEVVGRYSTHVDSGAERYIRQVLANAHMALSGLRGKAVAGSQVDPNNYYIFAISYTIDFMNGTASTSLARREGVISSPRGILSNHASQDDAPSSLFPFGCRVYWKPPDRHKREDLAEPAYYL